MKFLIRLLISALSLGLAAYLIPGFSIDKPLTLFVAALLLGIVNAIVRPVLFILTLPISIVTLGLFVFILNAAMIALVAWLLPGFTIAGFWSAFFGWLVVAVTSAVVSKLF